MRIDGFMMIERVIDDIFCFSVKSWRVEECVGKLHLWYRTLIIYDNSQEPSLEIFMRTIIIVSSSNDFYPHLACPYALGPVVVLPLAAHPIAWHEQIISDVLWNGCNKFRKLLASIYRNEMSFGAILFAHGNKSNRWSLSLSQTVCWLLNRQAFSKTMAQYIHRNGAKIEQFFFCSFRSK